MTPANPKRICASDDHVAARIARRPYNLQVVCHNLRTVTTSCLPAFESFQLRTCTPVFVLRFISRWKYLWRRPILSPSRSLTTSLPRRRERRRSSSRRLSSMIQRAGGASHPYLLHRELTDSSQGVPDRLSQTQTTEERRGQKEGQRTRETGEARGTTGGAP